MTRLAVTGGTGFVGSHLIDLALAAGHQVRALTRRPQSPRAGIAWASGALDDPASLTKLCHECDAVIHIAGVVNGDAATFHQGNVVGTQNMVAAAAGAGIERFIHISSLSAREPKLSAYGRSKFEGEAPIIAAGDQWTIIRPPAIYGPRDREMLDLFRFAKRGVLPLPPAGRVSIIHVDDLCGLMLACLSQQTSQGRIYEPDDGRKGGWTTSELGGAIARAVGRKALLLPVPQRMLAIGARVDRLLRGDKAKLTADRVAYFCHPDWVAAPHARPPRELWHAEIPTQQGLASTAAWYRAEGWL